MDQGGTNDELGHGEVASVCDCNRLEPLPDESRSFRFHQGPEAPNALVRSHSTCVRAEQDIPLVLFLPNLVPILSEIWTAGSILSKTAVFRASEVRMPSSSSSSQIALRLRKSQRENRRICFFTRDDDDDDGDGDEDFDAEAGAGDK